MKKTTKLLVLSALAMSVSSAVYAQLEEVIVTAEKRETDLQQTAISIQVYDGETLQKEGKTRIDEIMNGVVGVKSRDSQVGNLFFMRGVDGGNTAGGPGGQIGTTVSVLIDGVYQSRPETVRGGTLDVSQVEVSRGTQSTNLGANAVAGAVSLVTNKPVIGEWEAGATLGIGSYDLVDLSGVANVPLTDTTAMRFAYSQTARDGYLSSGAGDSDLTNARIKYRWLASDNVDATFTLSQNNIGGNGVQQGVLTASGSWEPYLAEHASQYNSTMGYPPFLGHLPGSGDPQEYRDRSDPWDDGYPADVWPVHPYRDTTVNSVSMDLTWDLSENITATIIPSYESAEFLSTEPPRGDGLSWMGENQQQDTTQLDARLNGKTDTIDWLAGVYYYDSGFESYFGDFQFPGGMSNSAGVANLGMNRCGYAVGNPAACANYSWNQVNDWSSTAYYGDMTWSVTDELRVQLGLRYSEDEKERQRANTNATDGYYIMGFNGPEYVIRNYVAGDESVAGYIVRDVDGNTTNDVTLYPFDGNYILDDGFSAKWDDVTYSLGVEYDVMEDAMVYATYKTGYMPGGVSTMGGYNATPASTSNQYTLGFKSRWLENTLQFNAEYFNIIFKDREARGNYSAGDFGAATCSFANNPAVDLQVASDYACFSNSAAQIVDQLSSGIDIEISWLPTDNDRLDFTMEWLDSTYDGVPYVSRSSGEYTVQELVNSAVSNGGVANTTAAQALLDDYLSIKGAYDGVTLQNAPDFTANLSYSHRFMFANGSSLTPKITAEHSSEYWSQGGTFPLSGVSDVREFLDSGSPYRQDSYTLWNASAAWDSPEGRFTLTAWIRNIDNEPVQINIGGEPGAGVAYVSLGPPRTYGLTLSGKL